MRIECLNVEEPVVGFPVSVNELEPGIKGSVDRLLAISRDVTAVDPVLNNLVRLSVATAASAFVLLGYVSEPWISFLSPHSVPRAVLAVIRCAAQLPVVMMIAAKMRVNSRATQ
jgi:hypothetical protein